MLTWPSLLFKRTFFGLTTQTSNPTMQSFCTVKTYFKNFVTPMGFEPILCRNATARL